MVKDVSFDSIKIGDSAELSKTVTEDDIINFAQICLDFNPIHLDHEFAKNSRFHKRIAHGMLSASLISAVIGTRLPGKNTIYLAQNLKFTAPVYIGDIITATVTVKDKKEDKNILVLETIVTNQSNIVVINGEAKVMKG